MLQVLYDEDDRYAYIQIGKNRFVRIGKKEDVEKLRPPQIAEKFFVSMACHEFNQLEYGPYIVH